MSRRLKKKKGKRRKERDPVEGRKGKSRLRGNDYHFKAEDQFGQGKAKRKG